MFAWGTSGFNLASGGEARYASGLWVSGDFFNVLGIAATMGRVLTPADDHAGCEGGGVVISHGFWQREFGGSARSGRAPDFARAASLHDCRRHAGVILRS